MKKIITSLFTLLLVTSQFAFSQTWLAMSTGLGTVKAIAVDPSGNIYAGGTFTGTCNYLAMWNGTTWINLGTGFDGPVYAIGIKSATDIYIGGSFSNAGGIAASNIVHYDGSNWTTVDSGFNAKVNCIYISGNNVYAGGQFSTSGSTAINHVSMLSNGQWTTLGSGIGGVVTSMTFHNSVLFAGTEILGSPVQMFENNSWISINGISSGKVYALTSYKNYLYVGGDFQLPYYAAAKWDGNSWSSITTTFNPSHKIYSFYNRNDSVLYIGGNYTGVGIGTPNYIGKIEGTSNSPVKKFTDISSDLSGGEVYAIGNLNGKVIVGGNFTTPSNGVAMTSTTVDVSEISNNILEKSFYPNPVTSKAFLKLSTKERLNNPQLQVYDLLSNRIFNLQIDRNQNSDCIEFNFDCSELPGGIYYYVISDLNKTILTDKFMVIQE